MSRIRQSRSIERAIVFVVAVTGVVLGAPALASGASVSGTVTDSDGNPASGVCVRGEVASSGFGFVVNTDAAGNYAFASVPPGTYLVRFGCDGGPFLREYYDDQLQREDATPITVGSADETGIDASLSAAGSIAGRVVSDETGEPLEGVCVQANTDDYRYAGNDMTDANGEYLIDNSTGIIGEADYRVSFSSCGEGNYLGEVYEDKGFEDSPDLVTVNGAVTGIDASLAPGGAISGTVTNEAGEPLAGVCVFAEQGGTSEETDASGDYTIEQLRTGDYTVRFYSCADRRYVAEYYDDELDFDQADVIPVTTGSETSGVDAALALGGVMTGRVTNDQGEPLADVCVILRDTGNGGYVGGFASTDGDGNYTMDAAPAGNWAVQFDASCYGLEYASEYYGGARTYGDADEVVIASEETTTGIDGELEPGGGFIAGMVRDENGADLDGVCVAAVDPDTGDLLTDYDVSRGEYGYFVGGLPVGPAVVKFYTDGCPDSGESYATEYWDDKASRSEADPIDLAPGDRVFDIDAELAPGAPSDTTAPDTSISSGPAGSTPSTSAEFAFDSSEDESTFECRLDGAGWGSCVSPEQLSGLEAGPHSFDVRATDAAGNTDQTPATRSWTVDPGSTNETTSGTVEEGGTVTSDPAADGATASDPITTSVTTPVGGPVTIEERPTSGSGPAGYALFDYEVEITADPASAADPLELVFRLDSSQVPAGTNLSSVTVLRNGSPAGDCSGDGTATPDPCVSSRRFVDGDLELTILSSHASVWNLGVARGADRSVSGAKVTYEKNQRIGAGPVSVSLQAEAAEPVVIKATGTIGLKKGETFELAPVTVNANARQRVTLTLRLRDPSAEAALQSALVGSKKADAEVTIRFRDAAGNTVTRTEQIHVRR